MKISTILAMLLVAAGLIACVPEGTLPGTVAVQKSGFDGRQYVEAAPGWIKSLADGKTSSYLLIGATIHSGGDAHLIAEVRDIVSINRFELKIGERVHDLEMIGQTKFQAETSVTVTNSQARFLANPALLREMASGQKNILVRVTTSDGYIEGDFGADCGSKSWGTDYACGGFRKMLKAAREAGLIE